ncbi:Holliday junction resolvase RuvX [Conyzicola nivalis]|uniref:Putative pre-16S rRNA nuclease n=1 Tax=Conyzicola nivalis TaxID=1477021 RepID=A0A916WFS2_9MICO|nr:Holliday junction resolvase RuvX [Conyzicola nivalis]GGA96591.1 putative pre-16S rRNA nuclease [Conyzicola nivalis]
MRSGVRLGIDVGTVRIGVARSDLHGMLATPVETVPRGDGDIARIVAVAAEIDAFEIIVGLPLALSGRRTASTEDAVGFAERLSAVVDVEVRLVDERLSTVSAQNAVRSSGKSTKQTRHVIDQVAAVIILQHALDFERSSERSPGVVVDPDKGLQQ